MTESRRRFLLPDWGPDHLSSDAIVAFVDNELAHGPHHRASRHLAVCPECAAQVHAQGQARSELRTADGPCLPSSLMSALRAIPQDADLPEPPAGLAMSAEGQLVDVLRPEAFLAPVPAQRRPDARPALNRRVRLGATVAVSGLAIGAAAFGVAALASGSPVPDRGGVNVPAVGGGVLDANLRATTVPLPAAGDHSGH